MKIRVKSNPENWEKEKSIKPNTVRKLDGTDTIETENTETGEVFTRVIDDITVWEDIIIISHSNEYGKRDRKAAP